MNGERTTFYPSKTSAVSQLELQTNIHEGSKERAAIRHYANQPALVGTFSVIVKLSVILRKLRLKL